MDPSFEREAKLEYDLALKKGKREYAALTSQGKRGTLAVLDEMVEQNKVMGYIKRPTQEILLSDIAGTYTSGRAYSFSAGFMPLHPEGSEFYTKWVALCAAHMEEGLRDAISVYEYKWKYYVVEGNKRVSVLKHFGAPTVRAEVTRLLPQLDEHDPESEVYYAFLRYDKHGLFKGVRMSGAQKYEQLKSVEDYLLAQEEGAAPRDFSMQVLQLGLAVQREKIDAPVGDVLLEYMKIYGLPQNITLGELQQRLEHIKPQLDLLAHEPKEPTLVMEAKEEAPVPLIERLFHPRKVARVLFAYETGRTENNWIGLHEKGRVAMEQELKDRVQTTRLDDLTPDNCYEALSETAGDYDLVLVTSARLQTQALRFALEYPKPLTLCYARVRPDARLYTYYGRYYEVAFLCGAAAGLATRTGKVAYITPKTEKRYTADINAFGLGVKSTNPQCTVYLAQNMVSPFDVGSVYRGIEEAHRAGADVVLTPLLDAMRLPDVPEDAFSAVMQLDDRGQVCRYIASPAWDWGRYYTEMVKSYLNHSLDFLREMDKDDSSIAGLWWGIGTGVLRFRMAEDLGAQACNLLRYLRGSISLGRFNAFHGPVVDSEGTLRIRDHQDPKPYDILNMAWIADFIIPLGV